MAKRKLSTRDKVILILSVVAIVAITIGVSVYYLMNTSILQDETGPVSFTSEVQTPVEVKEKSVNFLVVGVSDDEAERASTKLTDTIMVVKLDFENKQISALQIPRDTYVGDATSTGKINAIYAQNSEKWDYGGMQGLVDMIYKTFNLNIDHYVALKMDGFKNLVDAIGGVTMDVPKNIELNGTYVKAGQQTLNGEQAIAVVRTRNVYANADIGRLDTQKIFVSALADKALNLGFTEMAKIIPIMFNSLSTDLTLNQGLDYFEKISEFDLSNMVMMTVPGVPDTIKTQSVYCVYPERTTALINTYFKDETNQITPDQLQLASDVYEPKITEEEMQNIAYLSDLKNGTETEVPYISQTPIDDTSTLSDTSSDTTSNKTTN